MTCSYWSQPIIPHSPPSSSSQTLVPSANSSTYTTKRCRFNGPVLLSCRYLHKLEKSCVFGTPINTSLSFHCPNSHRIFCSASSDEASSDEEFSKKIRELALRFQLSGDNDYNNANGSSSSNVANSSIEEKPSNLVDRQSEFHLEPPEWTGVVDDIIIPSSIERKANSVDLPLSLRIIKRKLKWQDGIFRETGESAYCSMKKAFSSLVFMIRELHSYTLRMREILFMEDLEGILVRVQKEMHASFVWLFQQVFSHTPTLMVSVMILLANFTVYSMGSASAIAASPPPGTYAPATESVSAVEIKDQNVQKFDSSSLKTFKISSSGGKSTLIGSNNGGGGSKVRPVAGGTDGDGWQKRSDQFGTIVPHGASKLSSSSFGTAREAESVSGQVTREEELSLWNSIVDEASRMQALLRDISLDHETTKRFVSPIKAEIEPDDFTDYFKTELLYQTGLTQEPNNPLLLANYAQFLHLVAHDYDRAEEYFKRAIRVEGADADAEAYSKYASFLWRVRKDLWAAEETFLEAISADPTNSYYASSYAHFLWNTGGDDTCFPLSSPGTNDNNKDDV